MAIRTNEKQNFGANLKNPEIYGENIVFIKGGATTIEGKWVNFSDLKLDVNEIIQSYVVDNSRRIFNQINGILYVLITLNKDSKVEVAPSTSFNKSILGNIKVFPDISNKLPLILVKLQQDGSTNLKSFNPITLKDIEVYKGFGNFTIRGDTGDTGLQGNTGLPGITGLPGKKGETGLIGLIGDTGIQGYSVTGIQGNNGLEGESIYTPIMDRSIPPQVDFTADTVLGTIPLTVTFTNNTQGDVDEWSWDFGDGKSSTSSSPQNVFDSPGEYTIALRAEGVAGDGIKVKPGYIVVEEVVQAVFSAMPDPTGGVSLGQTIIFDASDSSGTITNYEWNFGDSSIESGSDKQVVTHVYSSVGAVTVTLTVTGSLGTDTTTLSFTVS